jgi:hypothetical protein
MGDELRETLDGTLGHFWLSSADVYKLDKSMDGYVRLAEDNLFHIDTLRTREFNSGFGMNEDRLPQPEAVYGMTSSTRTIFFDIAGVSQSKASQSSDTTRRTAELGDARSSLQTMASSVRHTRLLIPLSSGDFRCAQRPTVSLK